MKSQNLTRRTSRVSALGLALCLAGCQPAKFQQIGVTDSASGALGKIVETFDQGVAANKVDILIINDNSVSMTPEQEKLGERFGNFISQISDIDYQIAMTTTDIDSQNYNMDGRIMNWVGAGTTILKPDTNNQQNAFKNTIERQETSDCLVSGNCPSGNEQALGAMVRSFAHRNGANAGFFRDNTPLAIFVLSDEDEMSMGSGGTTASQVISAFRSAFGPDKRLAVYGIIIQPGDSACRNEQRLQPDAQNQGHYATRVAELAQMTGGRTTSICAVDYSQSLNEMSHDFRSLVTTYELSQEPRLDSVEVVFTPAQNIGYKIEGRMLILEKAAPHGTKIEVRYFHR